MGGGGGFCPLARGSHAISNRIILWSQKFLTLSKDLLEVLALSINIPTRRWSSHFFTILIGFPVIEFSGCSASVNQNNYNCLEAIDGITSVIDNGWAYNGGSSAWAIFELTEKCSINTLVMMSGQERNNHRLIEFKVTLEVDGQWINLTGLKVQEDPIAQIGGDGTVTLASGIHDLQLEFNAVSNVQSIRLDVTKTDSPTNNVVLNEIIPEHREVKL